MSLDLFPPRAIIGYVNMNGQKLPVEISHEFYRALRALVARVGGASSTDVAQSEIADAFAVGSESVGQLFFDVLQPVESQSEIADAFAVGSESVGQLFLDVVQPVQSRVLLPEIVQTSTENSFANETTYA